MSQSNNNIKLSIIMPLYNVEQTIKLALESVLMQVVDFEYEIIAVDDASTDNTLEILQDYAKKYKQIKIIEHSENQGNAIAFYDALCATKGDYFCVLDGDDYYTVKNKLQKQVDFLNNDKDCKYIAVTHKYLRINQNFEIFDEAQLFSGEQECDYLRFLQCSFYSHTTTYMYRNIFKNNVPEKFKEPLYRGDNPRTFLHSIYSKGWIKQLNFVGSVYYYNGNGIWSKTSPEAQRQRNIDMFEHLGTELSSSIEKYIWNETTWWKKQQPIKSNAVSLQQWHASEYVLNKLYKLSNKYAFKYQDFIFQQVYKSEFIDSFCESIGFVEMVKHGFRPFEPVVKNENRILIAVSNLTTTGGGVYHEIKDIIAMYPNQDVYILWTDVGSEQDLDTTVKEQLVEFKNLTCVYGQSDSVNKVSNLCDKIINIAPAKVYYYCGHNNVYLSCLIQSMLSKNICVFSFDHGFSLGLDNTNYDIYITKRPMDYEILSKQYGQKVIYMPCWNIDKIGSNKYQPFKDHKSLITACAAARYYKLSSGDGGYIDIIAQLLKKTGGKHIHYGQIPEQEQIKIKETLIKYGVDEKSFVNIPWAENLPESMLNEGVDIFIEPFPTVSYKITLEVLSAGIPIIAHNSYMRMGITDFIYPNHLQWDKSQDCFDTLMSLTKKDLEKHSKLSREYYEQNHLPDVIKEFFINEKNFKQPEQIPFYDNKLLDVFLIENLLNVELDNSIKNQKTKTQTVVKRKWLKFIEHLGIKKRYKEIFYGFILIIAQIPLIDLLIRSAKRQKLLQKILKYYR